MAIRYKYLKEGMLIAPPSWCCPGPRCVVKKDYKTGELYVDCEDGHHCLQWEGPRFEVLGHITPVEQQILGYINRELGRGS